MRRGMSMKVAIACLTALGSHGGLQAVASPADRPVIVGMIEQDFNGFFLLVTNGDGRYDVFQRLDDALGLSDDANVVCMLRDVCYLEIAHLPADIAAAYGKEGHTFGELRRRLTAVRDSYAALHAAAADARDGRIEAWHRATGRLASCLDGSDGCQ